MIRIFLLFVISVMLPSTVAATGSDSVRTSRKVKVRGYVKYLHQASFVDRIDEMQTNNLIHNRVNIQYSPTKKIQLRTDVRNRIFYGEMIRMNPGYSALLENPNDFFDLTQIWHDKNALILHTVIDRAYVNYSSGKWDVTLGRQRINWGINTIWTPNDIFNTYNFFDFDYEERPGSDGVRMQYSPNGFSAIEVAYKAGRKKEEHIGAMMYRFNRWNYDFQFFGGLLNTDATAGFGWAGNIKDAGFKGETTLLYPVMDHTVDSTITVLSTVSADYVFSGGWYVSGAFLYNQSGADELNSISSFYTTRLTLRNLMPFKYSWCIMTNKSFTPVLNASAVVIYSTSSNALIAVPSLTYSIADNWDLYLTGQLFFADKGNSYGTLGNSIFMRIKMAF